MKRLKLLSIVAPVLAFFGTLGCNHTTIRPPARSYAASSNSAYAPRATTYALAVSVNGGLQPTPGQWAALQAKFARDLAAAGQILVTDLALADQIIRVDFFPNEDNPEDTGRAVIVSIRPNNLRGTSPASSLAFASGGRYPTSFGFGGGFLDAFYAFGNSSYYGYGNSYYDGFSYATPTLNPQRPAPPTPVIPTHPGHRHHRPGEPRDPVKCPPLLAAVPPVESAASSRFAYPPSDTRGTTISGGIGRLVGERTYARADRNPDYSERNYARGAPSSSPPAQPDHSSSWFSRLFSSSDSRSSGSSSHRTTAEQTAASAERTYQRADRTNYSRSESGYSKNDSSYSRSESSYSPSSYSAPSYSPPPQSYSPPAYSPPPASYSAPSYSPPPAPATSTAETSTSKN